MPTRTSEPGLLTSVEAGPQTLQAVMVDLCVDRALSRTEGTGSVVLQHRATEHFRDGAWNRPGLGTPLVSVRQHALLGTAFTGREHSGKPDRPVADREHSRTVVTNDWSNCMNEYWRAVANFAQLIGERVEV